MSTDHVTPFVHELCMMGRFGGRCVQRECGVWEIADISQWSEEQAMALHRRFPSLSARVEASRRSLSGFCVILQQNRASHAWVAVLVCAILVSVLFSLTHLVRVQA